MGKWLMVMGATLFLVGLLVQFGGQWLSLGELPGDLKWTRGNTTVYFPLGTSLVLSVILTVLMQWWWRR